MKSEKRWNLAAAVLMAIGAFLRLLDLGKPTPALNPDEIDWAYVGVTLWRTGRPTGWTLYPTSYAHLQGWVQVGPQYWLGHVVTPYVDHPPLFSLIVGLLALARHDLTWRAVTCDANLRFLPVALSLLAMGLLWRLARQVLDPLPALIGFALLAVGPMAVLLDRLVTPEALLSVLLLAVLLGTLEGGNRWTVVIVVACAVAPLMKMTGALVILAAVGGLVAKGRIRYALMAGAAGALGIALALGYSMGLDSHAYLSQGAERAHLRSWRFGYGFITGPTGAGRWYELDPVWLAGWAGLALLLRRRWSLALVPLAYLTMLTLLSAEYAQSYGWYRVMILPLVYLGAGALVAELLAIAREPALKLLRAREQPSPIPSSRLAAHHLRSRKG